MNAIKWWTGLDYPVQRKYVWRAANVWLAWHLVAMFGPTGWETEVVVFTMLTAVWWGFFNYLSINGTNHDTTA